MHAVSCLPVVLGAWAHEGGGALHTNSGMFGWDKRAIEGLDLRDPSVRSLDQSRIGAVLTGDAAALRGGPPVAALFIQNTNPVSVAPDQEVVKRGFAREDLFTVVHEQVMTDTARMADLVLPATMFVEHDDVYQAGGQTHILLGPKLIEPPGDCLSNHEVLCGLAPRLGVDHPSFRASARDLVDDTLRASGRGTVGGARGRALDRLRAGPRARPFPRRLRLAGRALPLPARLGGRRGRHAGRRRRLRHAGLARPLGRDRGGHAAHPFRMTTSPARNFLNSSFTETPTGLAKEERPSVMIHPDDAAPLGIADGHGGGAVERARRGAAARQAVRRHAARRADRRIDLAQRRPRRRPRHQHAHGRRRAAPARRRRRARQRRGDPGARRG